MLGGARIMPGIAARADSTAPRGERARYRVPTRTTKEWKDKNMCSNFTNLLLAGFLARPLPRVNPPPPSLSSAGMNISFCIDIERARSYLRYGTSPELIPGGYTHPPTYTPRRPSPPGAFPFPGTPGAEQIYMRKLGA